LRFFKDALDFPIVIEGFKMETRLYFVAGDLANNALVGALVGLLMSLLIGPGWPMILAMAVGMVLGMIISLPFAFGLSALFGAMETMLPVMTTGMVSGMVVSMSASTANLGIGGGAEMGALSGLGVFAVTYLFNAYVKPRAAEWTK
jgi:hypothetical protein